MQLSSNLLLLAASFVTTSLAAENPHEWVTYTKHLGFTIVPITKYVGSSTLTGSEYTTRTIPVRNYESKVLYSIIVTDRADANEEASSTMVEAPASTNSPTTINSENQSQAPVTSETYDVDPSPTAKSSKASNSEKASTTSGLENESSSSVSTKEPTVSSASSATSFTGGAHKAQLSVGALGLVAVGAILL